MICLYIKRRPNRVEPRRTRPRCTTSGLRTASLGWDIHTVSFHNFKSQNFKLSVSNPKGKYVVYVSVLSQFSNCQSLGRKTNMNF